MVKDYELLAGDRVCARFENGSLTIIDEQFAPLYLSDFQKWVESRSISVQRGFTSRSIKKASGISATADAFITSMKYNCACITDNYWVRECGSDLTYKDVNYDNYDGRMAKLALGIDSDPYSYLSNKERHPELTNIGDSDKAWVIDDQGVRWLHKRQPLRECYSEILASKVASKLGIDTVEYELVDEKSDLETGRWGVVRSADFTQSKGANLEHAESLLKHFDIDESNISENAKIFDSYGCVKAYLDIIYLDIITGNPDRHERNYGILRSRLDGSVIGMAPNFDNNYAFRADLSLLSFAEAACEYVYTPPVLKDRGYSEILNETESFSGFETKAMLDSVRWKQKSVAEAMKSCKNTR